MQIDMDKAPLILQKIMTQNGVQWSGSQMTFWGADAVSSESLSGKGGSYGDQNGAGI